MDSPLDISLLPSIVLLRILKFLKSDFDDVRNLSLVNKCLRRRILQDLNILYNIRLVLDTSTNILDSVDFNKPVLSLILIYTDTLAQDKCTCNRHSVGAEEKCSIGSTQHKPCIVTNLDLSTLKYLEVVSNSSNGEAYRGVLRLIQTNLSLNCSKLEHLSVDVRLINLSEIRDAIINVVYQHDDFVNGANIDYVINSAISQVLYTFLIFVDGLYKEYQRNNRRLKNLQIHFQVPENTDWDELDPESFNVMEIEHLKTCLMFMINEFKERIHLVYGVNDEIYVTGIPKVFKKDILELSTSAISEACDLWPCEPQKKPFEIVAKDSSRGFDLRVRFPRPLN